MSDTNTAGPEIEQVARMIARGVGHNDDTGMHWERYVGAAGIVVREFRPSAPADLWRVDPDDDRTVQVWNGTGWSFDCFTRTAEEATKWVEENIRESAVLGAEVDVPVPVPAPRQPVVAMCEHHGRLIVATQHDIWVKVGDKLHPLQFVNPP